MTERELVIDAGLEALLGDVTEQTDRLLEASLQRLGRALHPIIVWKGKNIIVDGHRRLKACRKLGIPYQIEEIEFLNERDVEHFMRELQASRRNQDAIQLAQTVAYLLDDAVKRHRGDRMEAIQEVADATGQTTRTVRRHEDLKLALDALPEDVRKLIDSGQLSVTHKEVIALADLTEMHIRRVLREYDNGKGGYSSLWEAIQGEGTPKPSEDAPVDPGAAQERRGTKRTYTRKSDTVSKSDEPKERDLTKFFQGAFFHLGKLNALVTSYRGEAVGLANKILDKCDHIDRHLQDWKANGDEE